METDVDYNNPFATDKIWKLQRFSLDLDHPSESLVLEDGLPGEYNAQLNHVRIVLTNISHRHIPWDIGEPTGIV